MGAKIGFLKMLLILLVAVWFILPGCGQPKTDENAMPDVVFAYYEDKKDYDKFEEKRYDIWFIDREGALYHVMSNESYNMAQLGEEYKTSLKNICVCIKIIDYEELIEKYKILKEVSVSDKNLVEIQESELEWVLGTKRWSGRCYDSRGNIVYVSLHGEGDSYYTNKDPRAGELAKWMDAIVQDAMPEQ